MRSILLGLVLPACVACAPEYTPLHEREIVDLTWTLDETAVMLGVSVKTVQRDWLSARAWLRKEVVADLGL